MTDADEVRDLTRLAARELGALTGGIGEVHAAIATRVFDGVGPPAQPVRCAHQTIARGVYSSVRGAFVAAGAAGDAALAARGPGDRRAISATPRGAAALGVLNGVLGDALEAEGSALAAPMAVRVGGQVVAPTPGTLAHAFPEATPRLAVFVHGLMETEHAWHPREGKSYGRRLADDLGYTPLDLRFNSGLHISDNGRDLAALLGEIVEAWPVAVEQIALVGHSLGGLVARSAAHQAALEDAAWVRHVRHVVSLGSPHLGAPLAHGVHYAAHALHSVPELRPLGRFLRRRSAGIRDLRSGSLVDADWRGRDPDALRAVACEEVPLLAGATHCFVSATVTRDPRHPLGRLLGDALVLQPSATGRGRTRRLEFRDEHGLHVGATHHLALLRHPTVYARLRDWLAA